MKFPSLLRKTFLFLFVSTWILVVLFAFEHGKPQDLAWVFSFNILLLLVFTTGLLMDSKDSQGFMERMNRLIELLFGERTGIETPCFIEHGIVASDGMNPKYSDSAKNRVFKMGLHYPQMEHTWIQDKKQIRHLGEHLKIRLDASGRVVQVSDDVARYHSVTRKQLMRLRNADLSQRLSIDNGEWFNQVMQNGHAHAEGTVEYKGRIVKFFWFFKAVYNLDSHCIGIEGHARKITEFTEPSRPSSDTTDSLTGLLNSRGLYETLRQETSPNHAIAFFIDIDGFANINDYYGYAFGDKVLIHLAETFKTIEAERMVLGRVSADQFALIFIEDHNEGLKDIKRLMASYTQIQKTIDGINILINNKIGYASFPEHASTLEDLLAKANLALKHNTSTSPYAFVSYQHSIGDALKKQVHIAQRLKKALEKDALDIHFQRIVDVRTDSTTSVEALVRWTDSVYGKVHPVDIFKVAKASGMTLMLEKVLVEKALKLYKNLKTNEEHLDTGLALNLAPESLLDPTFLPFLKARLKKIEVDPRDVTIEVSERIFMNNLEACLKRISAYKRTGFKIAIDDFGKDFSSLSVLERIDFDVIKIDALFVKNIAIKKNQEIFKMVRSITDNARQSCIVEGVETKDQRHILEALGCYYQQGFLHHYPRPLE